MPSEDETTPNRILSHELLILSTDPLLGLLTLDTDQGTFEFAFNRSFAEDIAKGMTEAARAGED